MIVVNNIWDPVFFQMVADSRKSVKISSPELQVENVRDILDAKRSQTQLELVTGYGIREFFSGATSLDAVEQLVRQHEIVTGVPSLGANFAIFDDERAFVSSGNLTHEGPSSSKAYSFVVENHWVSGQLTADFHRLQQTEHAQAFTPTIIEEFREIIRRLLAGESPTLFSPREKAPLRVHDLIDFRSLNGWTMDVLEVVMQIPTQRFRLSDVYASIDQLRLRHPANNTIDAKIRQQLQVLRDLGLIIFVDNNGTYRKSWDL